MNQTLKYQNWSLACYREELNDLLSDGFRKNQARIEYLEECIQEIEESLAERKML